MTQAQLVALSQEVADAVNGPRWSVPTITTWLGLVHWQEWANLLNANNAYYVNTVTVTQDSNGRFAISDLTTGSGDSVKNFYRVLTLSQPTTPIGQLQFFYKQVRYQDYPNPQPNTTLPYVWYRFGTEIQVIPVQAGLQMQAAVCYRPCRADQLSSSSATVEFPDGYETLLAHMTARMMLMKGAAETDAAKELMQVGNDIRSMMLLDLARQGIQPIIAQAFDCASDWGG